jgi:DNA adenine methylase
MGRLYPFTYYGSKYRSLNFILDNLPTTDHYVEPFGGSGIVLLNREPAGHEVLNDLNGEITNFFQVLRDARNELISALELTPYSRREYERAVERRGDDGLGDVERARLFFIRCQQGRYSRQDEARTKGEWSRSTTQIRGENPMMVNRFLNKIDDLPEVAQRLRRVQIECRDAIQVINDYDDEDCVFYCDPPYVPGTRGDTNAYGSYEMSREDHEGLVEMLASCDGQVALSGYDNDLYVKNLDGWYVVRDDETVNQNGSTGFSTDNSETQEVLWTNYDPIDV